MRTVLAAITERKEAFAGLPFFSFLRDESLGAEQRLAFFPCMAHWIMSFADLNRYFLRSEPATDEYQRRVNVFSREDDDHWLLYIEDLQKLGFDKLYTGADWLKFLWSDETRANRMLSYRIARLVMGASAVQRLAIIEAMEEAANVFFSLTIKLAEQLQEQTGTELRYLGHYHFNLEAEHTGAGDHESLARIELDEETRRGAVHMVEEVFELFEDWADEVLRFAYAQLAKRQAVALPPVAAALNLEPMTKLRPVM